MAVHLPRTGVPRALVFAVAGLVLVAAVAWCLKTDDTATPAPSGARTPSGQVAAMRPDTADTPETEDVAALFHTGLEALPPSLNGTEVSGELEEDAQGNLKLTRGVRNVFDYFLSATGEESPARQRARLAAYIDRHLQPQAAAQARALLDTYLRYKEELAAQPPQARALTLADMRARVEAMQATRARHFDPAVAAAFFGDEDAYDRYSLARVAVLQDAALSPQAKARAIAALRAGQPEAQRQQMDVVEVVDTLDTLTTDWRQRAGTASELRQLREALVGPEAAGRLETLDRQNEVWNSRVAAYQQQRTRILGDVTLAESTRQQQVDALRSEAFSANERLRIETIERIEESGARDATSASRLPTPG